MTPPPPPRSAPAGYNTVTEIKQSRYQDTIPSPGDHQAPLPPGGPPPPSRGTIHLSCIFCICLCLSVFVSSILAAHHTDEHTCMFTKVELLPNPPPPLVNPGHEPHIRCHPHHPPTPHPHPPSESGQES